ncbi:MAG: hypothetical protein K8S99_00010 [Planctomycetes bacterium]|nr:hypothetical protein [Planctomycetota bacterium]
MPRLPAILFVTTVAVVMLARILGPSDIYDQHQPRTIAYTADIVVNGHWVLPVDAMGKPATKPLLYNWIGALAVMAVGRWDEWLLRLPSLLAGGATMAITLWMARRLSPPVNEIDSSHDERTRRRAVELALYAGVAWITCYPVAKLVYLARPDMLLVACMTASWAFATVAMEAEKPGESTQKRSWSWALAFWLAVGLAGLAKGPAALAGVIYALLAAKLIHGRWSAVNRLHWWWGLPLALLLPGAWLYAAYRINPAHVHDVLFGEEVRDRVTRDGWLGPIIHLYQMPLYFLIRFLPWSLGVIVALVVVPPRRWMSHALAPAILWIFVLLAFFTLASGGRADYIAPIYGPAAVVAAFGAMALVQRARWMRPVVAAAPLVTALVVAWFLLLGSPAYKEKVGEHLYAFMASVRPIVGSDTIHFEGEETQTLRTLMGRAYPADPARDAAARWVIRLIKRPDDAVPETSSDRIRDGAGNKAVLLGLFRKTPSVNERRPPDEPRP